MLTEYVKRKTVKSSEQWKQSPVFGKRWSTEINISLRVQNRVCGIHVFNKVQDLFTSRLLFKNKNKKSPVYYVDYYVMTIEF